jgi:hypothetical protein
LRNVSRSAVESTARRKAKRRVPLQARKRCSSWCLRFRNGGIKSQRLCQTNRKMIPMVVATNETFMVVVTKSRGDASLIGVSSTILESVFRHVF